MHSNLTVTEKQKCTEQFPASVFWWSRWGRVCGNVHCDNVHGSCMWPAGKGIYMYCNLIRQNERLSE